MLLPLIACLGGAALGLRFDVLILLPATLLAFAAVAVSAFVTGMSGAETALELAAVAGSLQVGYLAGILSRHALDSMRGRGDPDTPTLGADPIGERT